MNKPTEGSTIKQTQTPTGSVVAKPKGSQEKDSGSGPPSPAGKTKSQQPKIAQPKKTSTGAAGPVKKSSPKVTNATSVVTSTTPSTTKTLSIAHNSDAKVPRGVVAGTAKDHATFLRQRRQLEQHSNDNNKINKTITKIEQKELAVRSQASWRNNPFVVFIENLAAAVKVFAVYLISIDTIVCNIFTIGMTIYWYELKEHNQAWHGAMSFILVSFAVASLITVALRMAFDRREKALTCVASVRSFAMHIYLAHALWDWKGKEGRSSCEDDFDFLEHCDQVLDELVSIGDEMTRFLTLPTFSKSRHRVIPSGRQEAKQTIWVTYHLLESILLQHMTRLTVLAEKLKAIGLSGSEISRVRQYERHLSFQLEQLRMYKVYRTPQALWAFARIFTLLLPPFYAPTFTEVARETHQLWLGISFAVITATCLTSLLESVQVLEDPFTAFITLDGMDVSEELEVLQWTQLINARKLLFPQAKDYPTRTRPALTGENYDPSVHYHSIESMWEKLMQQQSKIRPGVHLGNQDPFEDDEDEQVDLEVGQGVHRPQDSQRKRRRSHFCKTT